MSIVQPKYLVTGVSQNKCFTVFSIALGNEVMGYMNGTRLQQGDWIEATIERGEDGEFAVHTYRLTESPMKTYYEYYLNTLSMETHVYVPPQEWCAANDFPDNDRFVYNRHLGKVALPTYDANKWKVMAAQRGKPFSAVVMMAPTYAKANEVGALFIVDRLDKLNAHHTDPSLVSCRATSS
ncbi:hypothetical protein QR680_015360 [Steinernema hermaphroditum]|uniref:Uncharacterized protein n=1 Tax=Steinernema hermaphroditum TaxID=289476 RepID=A0AA39H8F6_9BILA|nr:hypothetical protein QR680_015360 [Steinernema hermaphroditum]